MIIRYNVYFCEKQQIMGKKGATPIAMEGEHRIFYERLESKHTLPKNEYVRIRILLLSHSGMNNSEVSRVIGVCLNTVKKWRNKWDDNYKYLIILEGEKQIEYLRIFLKDAPRSGTPKKFSMSQEQAIVALACSKPRDYDIQMTDWTMEMLCKVSSSKKIVQSISTSQVSRLLKNTDLTTAQI
jgi:transposase